MESEAGGDGESGSLVDQVAVVTGGGRGLGRVIACHLAAEGARVVVASRTMSELEETVDLIAGVGGTATAFVLDVTDREAVVSVMSKIERRLGQVDLLVNDAAVVAPLGPLWEVPAAEWWRHLQINLYGSFLCAHTVLPGMTGRGRGRIVNLVSTAGLVAIPFASAS